MLRKDTFKSAKVKNFEKECYVTPKKKRMKQCPPAPSKPKSKYGNFRNLFLLQNIVKNS